MLSYMAFLMDSQRERFNIWWILDCITATSTSGDTITYDRETKTIKTKTQNGSSGL